jgi:hypothetical protein
VSGPPWPALIAPSGYTPPPLLRWPVAAGVAVLAVYVALLLSGAFSVNVGTVTHAGWLVNHESAIRTLNRDQTALGADNPTTGGNAAKWLADWRRFHDDAVVATGLPNPGGSATVPWREMLNDYVNGSSEIVQAIATRNSQELSQAQLDLQAGDQAAHRFNQAMGLPTP